MRLLKRLWHEDSGLLLSAEAVVVGTVAVVGLTAGVSALATSVNEELRDVSFAIRSLDQSYCIPGRQGCGACTAGSSFTQAPVKESLERLDKVYRRAEQAEQEESQADSEAQKSRPQAERLEEQMKRQEAQRKNEAQKKRLRNNHKI